MLIQNRLVSGDGLRWPAQSCKQELTEVEIPRASPSHAARVTVLLFSGAPARFKLAKAGRIGPRLLIVFQSTPRKRDDRPPPRQDESMWGMWGGGPGRGGGRSPACAIILH